MKTLATGGAGFIGSHPTPAHGVELIRGVHSDADALERALRAVDRVDEAKAQLVTRGLAR